MNPMENLNNPFAIITVSDPRQTEKAVVGLNDRPLQTLLHQFEEMTKSPLPRKNHPPLSQMVVSPAPGYGKSHLIGRLFKKLSRQATVIYIPPFGSVSDCWKSILHRVVQELDFPDDPDREYGEPTQLESFSHGILKYLLMDGVETGTIGTKDKPAMLNELNALTIEEVRKGGTWLKWIRKNYKELVNRCGHQLKRNDIPLNVSEKSWMGVFFSYAYSHSEDDIREACLDWLKGGPIAAEHAQRIGIKLSENPSVELPADSTAELCKNRILDLTRLAGFFRPFVFCFDQTENYGNEITLSKAFGIVIQVLTDYGRNQMTVITANQHAWTKSVEPWWEEAHRQRLSPHLELEGLNAG